MFWFIPILFGKFIIWEGHISKWGGAIAAMAQCFRPFCFFFYSAKFRIIQPTTVPKELLGGCIPVNKWFITHIQSTWLMIFPYSRKGCLVAVSPPVMKITGRMSFSFTPKSKAKNGMSVFFPITKSFELYVPFKNYHTQKLPNGLIIEILVPFFEWPSHRSFNRW